MKRATFLLALSSLFVLTAFSPTSSPAASEPTVQQQAEQGCRLLCDDDGCIIMCD